MEKRKSERVQFFQLGTGKNIQPIWVFSEDDTDAIAGLLLDISPEGAQVLINKSEELDGENYQMIIHLGEDSAEAPKAVNIRRLWSHPEGTLYIRNGFDFEEQYSLPAMPASAGTGTSWLRCELLPR